MTDISVFYNCCDLRGHRNLSVSQMIRLCQSDLMTQAKNVYVMLNGDLTEFLDLATLLENNPNVRIVHTNPDASLMEWPGLTHLKNYCDAAADDEYVMYFHIKGVTHLTNTAIHDWRRYLEYWNIDRWQDCVAKLDQGFETVGTNFINEPFLGIDRQIRNWNHYSGNFWWARSSYIKRLKPLPHPNSYILGTPSELTGYSIDKTNYRFDHEAWIASGKPNFCEIDRTPGGNHSNGGYPGWHYHHSYPESCHK